jgi:hypothetical protein
MCIEGSKILRLTLTKYGANVAWIELAHVTVQQQVLVNTAENLCVYMKASTLYSLIY